MARIRGFKPQIWTDWKFTSVTRDARLTFFVLMTMACDNGHVEDEPRQIKSSGGMSGAIDQDATPETISGWLDELAGVGLIERSNGVLTIPKLRHHQGRAIDPRYFTGCDLVPGCQEEALATRKAPRGPKKEKPQVTGHGVVTA